MAKGPDTQGAPAAGQPKDLSKGEQAENGDTHREYRQHQGKTRGGTAQEARSGNEDAAGSTNDRTNP